MEKLTSHSNRLDHIENGDLLNGLREWDRLQEKPEDHDDFDETKEDEKRDRGET